MIKHLKGMAVAAALGVAAIGAGGCGALLIGAAAGAGAGAVYYVGNELRVTREVSLDRAWEAAGEAMKEMEYTVIPAETRKDKTGGVVQGRNAKDQIVRIELIRQSDKITEIRVRVGAFETAANKSAEQLLYEKMSKLL